jgi:hypothetical protein
MTQSLWMILILCSSTTPGAWTNLCSWMILMLSRFERVIAIYPVAWATIFAGPTPFGRLARLALNAVTPMTPTLAALLSFQL